MIVKRALMIFFIFISSVAVAQEPVNKAFNDFINDDTDGRSFEDAIILDNECDFSACKDIDCARQIFNDAITRQEVDYVERHYGKTGISWDVSGQSSVDVYKYARDRYYDGLGIRLFSDGQKIALYFDITSSVHELRHFEYNIQGE